MPDGLLDLRKMRPEPLRPEVQLGPSLTLGKRMGEEPPLIRLERQRFRFRSVGTQRCPLSPGPYRSLGPSIRPVNGPNLLISLQWRKCDTVRLPATNIVQALRKHDITVYGDGSQTRSFCYVDDLVDGLIRLMETSHDVTGPINLGNPVEYTIRELAETTIALTGSSSKIVHQPLPPDDPKQRQPDITRAQELLGWEPKVQLEEGLRKAIEYFDRLLGSGLAPVDEKTRIAVE
jgi:hypothetical protein